MHGSRTFRLALSSASILSALACTALRPGNPGDVTLPGRIITEEMIASYNVANAWDVLQRSGAYHTSRNDSPSGATNLRSKRGKTSVVFANSDVPRLVIDGARVADLRLLRDIPARSIAWIQLLNGMDGTLFEGTNSGAGVIMIVTKAGL